MRVFTRSPTILIGMAMNYRTNAVLVGVSLLVSGLLTGCSSEPSTAPPPVVGYADTVVWAVNVGGPAHDGIDGVTYRADEGVLGGTVQAMERVKGSQDSTIYQSYRAGDIVVQQPLPNGTYDLTFHFAEPEDLPVGTRIFDVFTEDTHVIESLDVRLARDGKHISALTRTVSGVEVTDGQLDVTFAASAGEPVLSALVVRQQVVDTRAWKLVWQDEFEYTGPPDSMLWNIETWPARKVNDEDQAYTAREKNVRVENGLLILEAHKEAYDTAEYTSGRIQSQGKGDILYGRVEVRAKLPAGQGTWPAIWMLPSNPYTYATTCSAPEEWQGSATCDAWPNSGEIDIMEHVGYDMNNVHGTVHNKAYYWINWEQRKGSIEAETVDEAFHVYALEWTPERIDVFYNGTRYFTYMNEGTGWRAWPYDHPYHLILNVAVGGMWGRAGGPIDDSIFPVHMEVDYVRMYQLANESALVMNTCMIVFDANGIVTSAFVE